MDLELCKMLVGKYGKKQIVVCIEELGELQKELCKYLRKGYTNDELKDNIVEEMADVYIMLEQMKIYFNINEDRIANEILNKNKRTELRLKSDKL